jgi:hypothetical protein
MILGSAALLSAEQTFHASIMVRLHWADPAMSQIHREVS